MSPSKYKPRGLYLEIILNDTSQSKLHIISIIIQQIVTLTKYGHDALDICHPQVTDIRRYM